MGRRSVGGIRLRRLSRRRNDLFLAEGCQAAEHGSGTVAFVTFLDIASGRVFFGTAREVSAMNLDSIQFASRFDGVSGSAIREIFKMIALLHKYDS